MADEQSHRNFTSEQSHRNFTGEVLVSTIQKSISLEDLAEKIDAIGNQMDWLCTNLASLFTFAQQMGNNGGGIRGMLNLLKGLPAMEGNDNNAG
jgi:hypothetical protein